MNLWRSSLYYEHASPVTVMPDNLYQIRPTFAENEQLAGEWIGMQRLLDLKSKRREAAAHVGMAGRQPDPCVTRKGNHLKSSSARTTRTRRSTSTAPSIRTRRPFFASMTIRLLDAAETAHGVTAPVGASATRTETNRSRRMSGPGAPAPTDRDHRFRLMPCDLKVA